MNVLKDLGALDDNVILYLYIPPEAAHWKSDCLWCAVLLCLVVCLILLASFFLLHLSQEALTPMGKALAELPIEPLIGRLVLLGAVLGALDPILTIAAAMGYRDPFVNPPTKRQQADEVVIHVHVHVCNKPLSFLAFYLE